MEQNEIHSLQNPQIKHVVQLQEKAKIRTQYQLFVVEGYREINMAKASRFELFRLYVCLENLSDTTILKQFEPDLIRYVSKNVFEKIAYREHTDGFIALFKQHSLQLSNLNLSKNPLIIILEGVEKPGNLGAILRTADAAGIDAVLVCDPKCDIYNPNVVRSSLGCIFSVPLLTCTADEVLVWLHNNNITSFAAELKAAHWYHDCNFTGSSALIMGTEATGLSRFWLDHADNRIKIPMLGKADSLNVSVSTAVLTFEAMRQRNFIVTGS